MPLGVFSNQYQRLRKDLQTVQFEKFVNANWFKDSEILNDINSKFFFYIDFLRNDSTL
jgi:hypothetical protein